MDAWQTTSTKLPTSETDFWGLAAEASLQVPFSISTGAITMNAVNKTWLISGEAIFTVEIPEDHRPEGKQQHYTFKIVKAEPNERYPNPAWFAKVFVGPDNTNDDHYLYLGKLNDHLGRVELTKKSALPRDSYRLRLLNKILNCVWMDDHHAFEHFGFQLHHEGMCGCCGKKLTVPLSVETGYGEICFARLGLEYTDEQKALQKRTNRARAEARKTRKPRTAKNSKKSSVQA